MNVAGGDISGGDNSANQTATNGALSAAGNLADTDQSNNQTQSADSSCYIGCGGAGQAQLSEQKSLTAQLAASKADANQNAVNANVPVNIAGGDVYGGDNSANQTATNGAFSAAGNLANTDQSNNQTQSAGSSCFIGCGGAGQAQLSSQESATLQAALSKADAHQNAVNANVPVNIAGGDIYGGDNSANQTATNGALQRRRQSGQHRPEQQPDPVRRLQLLHRMRRRGSGPTIGPGRAHVAGGVVQCAMRTRTR